MTRRAVPFGEGGEKAERGSVRPTRTVKPSRPSTRARRPPSRPPLRGVPGDEDICSNESTSRRDQASQDCRRDGKWWICDDPIGTPWRSQIDRIGDDNSYGLAREPSPQIGRPLGMELTGNDMGTTVEEMFSESTGAGADVYDKIARTDPASRTICCAHRHPRRCHPQRVRFADTTHHREDRHGKSVVHTSTMSRLEVKVRIEDLTGRRPIASWRSDTSMDLVP